ncbi:MAG: DUF1801 domain-containing protein [Bacteroidia bacterium]|nr:DUF1801 domain-containing protein [Bacteroidia bacterium]
MATQRNPEVDEYIATFPPPTQDLLEQMRSTILKAAPGVEEVIGYKMPAYRLHGVLLYFAGYKAHIGFYPSGSAIEAFKKELSAYKGAKGSVQFPLDRPLPVALITKIVKLRVKENLEKAKEKELKKNAAKKRRRKW